jgi:Rod binding domain-containing protein
MTSPISPAAPPDASRAENSRRELQARLAGLGDLRGRKLTPEQKEKKLREACEGFESVFIQKMWQEMRKTVPQGNLLHGREEKFWQDMYDQELAKKMTSAGGIGLADMMYRQLSQNLVSATRGSTGMTPAAAFRPSAAPLLPQNGADREAAATRQDGALQPLSAAATPPANALPSIYEGIAPQHDAVKESAAEAGIRTAHAATPMEADPPEVREALARLRLQQTAPEIGRSETVPAGRNARNYPQSGLDLARTAQREAGTKLGPAAVRPPLHPAAKNRERQTTTPMTNPIADNAADSPAAQAPQEGTQAVANSGRKVRHTTNTPPGRQRARGRINGEMLRAMQTRDPAPGPPPLTPPLGTEAIRNGADSATAGAAADRGGSYAAPPLTAS